MDIYQQLWNADQVGNGIKPVLKDEHGNDNHGYIVVNELAVASEEHKLFTRVAIPEHKQTTYEIVKKLFNNYNLAPSLGEINTPEENAEVHELLESAIRTPVMELARDYVAQQTGESYNSNRWYKTLMDIWFTQFTQGSGQDLSAFEHIVIGEQKGGKISGYHFWYKYWLDDENDWLGSDDIKYLGTRGEKQDENRLVPEVSTLSYRWDAYDYDTGETYPLYKKIGGFFNGCSIEGLLALGTVRFLRKARAPKESIINNARYDMRVYRSSNDRHMRTFYPIFLDLHADVIDNGGEEEPTRVDADAVRIVSALVNPAGHDEGIEQIYLANLSPENVRLVGWVLTDKNNNKYKLDEFALNAREIRAITLPRNTVQLSNKGGVIKLTAPNGQIVQNVSYTKAQAKREGWLIHF